MTLCLHGREHRQGLAVGTPHPVPTHLSRLILVRLISIHFFDSIVWYHGNRELASKGACQQERKRHRNHQWFRANELASVPAKQPHLFLRAYA